MNIPFLDLTRQYAQIKPEILARFEQICDNVAFSGGEPIAQFEANFARYCHTDFAVALNNGTSAVHLAMLVLGVGQGDEVIVPANTFIASAWGASYCGATPVFVDCDAETWQIDARQIEAKISTKTRAIVGVHLYGQPFDIDAAQAIANKYNIPLIEDAAQAHGASYKGRRVGGFGEMACFSFYPGKNLGAYGEGGGITTNKEAYAKRLQSLRFHGSTTRYYHDEIGFNMRMGGLEAGSLDVKLAYLDGWNERRKEIARRYQAEITNSKVCLQKQPDFADSVYHLFVVTVEERDACLAYLKEKGIFAGLHYPVPCHLQKAYEYLGYQRGDLPNAEYLAAHCLSLPMFAELTDEEVSYVIKAMNDF